MAIPACPAIPTISRSDRAVKTAASEAILAEYRERAKGPGLTASERGDP